MTKCHRYGVQIWSSRMETRALRYFVAAAEDLNLRKASDRLGI